MVEYRLAKARVAGSNPVSCSQRDRKKSHPMDGSFFYVRALPGSNGSNVCAPLRSSQANVPRMFCDASCSFLKDIQCGCPFFVKKSFTSGVYYKKLLEKVCTLSKKSLEKVYILSKSRLKKFVISYITPLKK